MVRDDASTSLARTVLCLQRSYLDPQSVLSHLVNLYRLLLSNPSSPALSLPAGPTLSEVVQTIQQLFQKYTASEEEIVWYLCRVVTAWSRSSQRFKFEAGHIYLWRPLVVARAAYPDSPRVLETSLEANVALFVDVELHQFSGSREDDFVDEMLKLMDRFHNPPARVSMLSPHYDFSRLVVLAVDVLTQLFSSPRVTLTGPHGNSQQLTRHILERMLVMLPHFLKDANASRTWLQMCALQLKYEPSCVVRIVFTEASTAPSWCHQISTRWRNDARVTYAFAALFSQTLAVPHGSKILPASTLNEVVCRSIIVDHRVLDIMINLLNEYSARLQDPAISLADRSRVQPVVLEIARAIRQLSSVPDMLTMFPNCLIAKKSLVSSLLAELSNSTEAVRTERDTTAVTHHMRLLLELLLTLQQVLSVQVFARVIKSADTLPAQLSQATKRISTVQSTGIKSNPHDAGDSELPAVLHRELKKTMTSIAAIPAASATREKHSASRGLRRLPSSTSSSGAASRPPSITQTTLATSTHSLRRTASSSSTSSLSLVRTNSQRHV